MTSNNLKDKASSGFFWSVTQSGGRLFAQFVVQIALARLIAPADFGIVAIASVFLLFTQIISQGGFADSIIQNQDTNERDLRTAFTTNLLLGIAFAALLWGFSSTIADAYQIPQLSPVLKALSINSILNQLGGVHSALLLKDLQFKKLLNTQLPAMLISGAIGIALAYWGFKVWALVAQAISSALINQTLLLYHSKWIPKIGLSKRSLVKLAPYGIRIALNNLLERLSENLYTLIIGKLYTTTDVAIYHRANNLKTLPLVSTTQAFSRVTHPLFSQLQNNPKKLNNAYKRALFAITIIVIPSLSILAINSEEIIFLLLKDKWLPAAPYLEIFCAIGCLQAMNTVNFDLLKALGKAKLILRLGFVKTGLQLIAIALTANIGLPEMVLAQAVAMTIYAILLGAFANREKAIQTSTFFTPTAPAISIAAILFIANTLTPAHNLPALIHVLSNLLAFASLAYLYLVIFKRFHKDDIEYFANKNHLIRSVFKITKIL